MTMGDCGGENRMLLCGVTATSYVLSYSLPRGFARLIMAKISSYLPFKVPGGGERPIFQLLGSVVAPLAKRGRPEGINTKLTPYLGAGLHCGVACNFNRA